MKTPEEIKKGLECCANDSFLCKEECPYFNSLSNGVDCAVEKNADALALIEQLETQVPKWISVHEALPGMDKSVLFHPMCNEKSIYIGQFSYVGKSGAVYFAVRSGKRKVTYSATHWMPLPEPPTEETSHV